MDAGAAQVIAGAACLIVMLYETLVAAEKLILPVWLVVTMQIPTPVISNMPPGPMQGPDNVKLILSTYP
jgi:hypothetical protein